METLYGNVVRKQRLCETLCVTFVWNVCNLSQIVQNVSSDCVPTLAFLRPPKRNPRRFGNFGHSAVVSLRMQTSAAQRRTLSLPTRCLGFGSSFFLFVFTAIRVAKRCMGCCAKRCMKRCTKRRMKRCVKRCTKRNTKRCRERCKKCCTECCMGCYMQCCVKRCVERFVERFMERRAKQRLR